MFVLYSRWNIKLKLKLISGVFGQGRTSGDYAFQGYERLISAIGFIASKLSQAFFRGFFRPEILSKVCTRGT